MPKSSRRNLLIIAAALIATGLYYLFLITRGEMNLVAFESMGQVNAHGWDRLTQGHWDVDPTQAGFELFFKDGRYYTYFGIFPTLVRGLLTLFYSVSTPVPRLELWIPSLLWVVANLLIFFELGFHKGPKRTLGILFLITLILGSPVIFILTPAYVYHQAIMWSISLASVFALLCLKWMKDERKRTPKFMLLMGLVATCTLLSRVTMGVSCFLILAFLVVMMVIPKFAKTPRSWPWIKNFSVRHIVLVCATLTLFGSSLLYVNYKKFGSPFESVPLQYYVLFLNRDGTYNQRGQAFFQYGTWRWDCIVPDIEYYFWPRSSNIMSTFPFLKISGDLDSRPFADYMDNIEAGMPLTVATPFLLLLSAVCLVTWRRSKTFLEPQKRFLSVVLVAYAFPIVLLIGYWSACLRYEADFLPFLSLSSYLGVYHLRKSSSALLENEKFVYLCVGLMIVSIYAVHATYLTSVVTNIHIAPETKTWFLHHFMPGVQISE